MAQSSNLNFYGKLFRYCLFPLYESFLRRRNTLKYLDDVERVLTLSREEVEQIQFDKLKRLLEHAYNNVPYYRQTWDKLHISFDDIKSVSDLEKLPVLTKDIVRNNYEALRAKNYIGKSFKKATGGSTGQPFAYEYNYDSHKQREAIAMRGYGMAGANLGVKTWQLWGQDLVQPTWFKGLKNDLFHAFYNRKIVNSFDMNENNIDSYVADYQSFKPDAIVSYTSPLYQLAQYIVSQKIKVHNPKTILTGAEPLYDFQRQIIEQAFGAKVKNTYGCREVMLIASEIDGHEGLFVNDDHLVVEIVNDEATNVVDITGRVLLTDLSNFAMPLIRYENGDQAIKSSNQNESNPLSVLSSIEGRKLDVIKTPCGKLLPGEFFPHLLKDFDGIVRFQVVQEVIDKLEIKIIRDDKYSLDSEQVLKDIIRSNLGEDIELFINYVDDIPLTQSGKYRVAISKIGSS